MKEIIRKYKKAKGTRLAKVGQLLLVSLITVMYLYIVILWTPETYVSISLTSVMFKYIKVVLVIILGIYMAIQFDINFIRSPKVGYQQLQDYELWNKFFLHLAFMKTGSSNEKSQVLEILNYLEDSELKETLNAVYEENASLKDAYNQIIEKYPYPQVKTFFSESEDALVKGADGNRLMQKTALNIDKYIGDIRMYNDEKNTSYKVSIGLLTSVLILVLIMKIGFGQIFISFADSYIGIAILICFFIYITKLITKVRREAYSSLIKIGGEDNE